MKKKLVCCPMIGQCSRRDCYHNQLHEEIKMCKEGCSTNAGCLGVKCK
jgi:hypothetical protein